MALFLAWRCVSRCAYEEFFYVVGQLWTYWGEICRIVLNLNPWGQGTVPLTSHIITAFLAMWQNFIRLLVVPEFFVIPVLQA